MTVFHNLEAVTLEVDIAVKVHLVEGLHGDLVVATVLDTVGLLLEVEVVLDTTVRKANLVILARADGRDNKPPDGEHRKIDDEGKEDGGLEATTKLPAEPPRDQSQEGDENIVVEGIGTRTIGGKGSVLDGRVPGSRNTNILKLVKVRLRKGGSFHKLEVEAGDP
jgi:CDGSH-type Zn-finger protein